MALFVAALDTGQSPPTPTGPSCEGGANDCRTHVVLSGAKFRVERGVDYACGERGATAVADFCECIVACGNARGAWTLRWCMGYIT